MFPGALGDFLLALPALRALRARHPEARWTLVVHEGLRALAGLAALAAEVASLDGAATAWLFGATSRPAWLADWPAVYAWIGSRDPEVAQRLATVASAVELHAVVRNDGREHAAVVYARAVGVEVRHPGELVAAARLSVPPSGRLESVRRAARTPWLVLHRGAGAASKRWLREGFMAVAHAWQERGGAVLDLLGPAEHDETVLPGAVAVRDWPLPDVAALLAAADAYVGCDSGVSHLAGAVGSRGVVVFGPTSPQRWRPLAPSLAALAPEVGAAAVRVEAVLAALARVPTLTTRRGDTIDRA